MAPLDTGLSNLDDKGAALTAYASDQALYVDYLCMANECEKLLAAVEICDGQIDYLDFCTETRAFACEDEEDDPLIPVFRAMRAKTALRFSALLDELRERMHHEMYVTPTLADNRHAMLAYLDFKKTVNTLDPEERAQGVPELATHLSQVVDSLPNDSLDKLLNSAIDELEDEWPTQFAEVCARYGADWHQSVSFGGRLLLEQQGIFPYKQDDRHRVFQYRGISAGPPTGATRIQLWLSWLQRRAIGGKVQAQTVDQRREVYITPSLERYLCIRDMYQNTYRKFGRALPISMSRYLIKTYEEPAYWSGVHRQLDKLDLGRVGFAYFGQAMDMGRNSAYALLLLRHSLYYFRRAGITLPDRLLPQVL
ncbi:hypothetical protein N8198_02735 [Gammaproteobacteria bacterium]|nr:hypothetical protein [Gammaproteobacteria bacterium]